jgi:hypothetical protein
MKYHKHTIKKVYEDLGEMDDRLNYIYEIYNEKGEHINDALTLDSAKEYIDSDYDDNYL